jgi:hypothetical protein
MCYRNIEGKGQTQCYSEQVLWEVNADFDVRGVFAIDASGQDCMRYFETRNEAENVARDEYIADRDGVAQ